MEPTTIATATAAVVKIIEVIDIKSIFKASPTIIEGTLVEDNKIPIAGATIKIGDDLDTTAMNGKFIIKDIKPGKHTIAITYQNKEYKDVDKQYIEKGQKKIIEITLKNLGKTEEKEKQAIQASTQKMIQEYCEKHMWKIAKISAEGAEIIFKMSTGNEQHLYIIQYGNTLEFSVPSGATHATLEDVPHQLSTLLLKKNAELRVGFWAIEKIGDMVAYSIIHNIVKEQIDEKIFGEVVQILVFECEKFEQALVKAATDPTE